MLTMASWSGEVMTRPQSAAGSLDWDGGQPPSVALMVGSIAVPPCARLMKKRVDKSSTPPRTKLTVRTIEQVQPMLTHDADRSSFPEGWGSWEALMKPLRAAAAIAAFVLTAPVLAQQG